GLVAAYGFDEGTGSTTADASGNGNMGAITNATWTASGKFGSALVFNGSTALVTIADAASLDLTTGMTLMAWVKPSTITTEFRQVVSKGYDAYGLYGTTPTNGGAPAVNANVPGGHAFIEAPSALTVDVWAHLAATYEGATCTNFAQIATPPGASYADTGLAASTTYRYQVRATDAAGNLSGYSNVASATTPGGSPGLVAAYGFDEGTGSTTADASGNGNM